MVLCTPRNRPKQVLDLRQAGSCTSTLEGGVALDGSSILVLGNSSIIAASHFIAVPSERHVACTKVSVSYLFRLLMLACVVSVLVRQPAVLVLVQSR